MMLRPAISLRIHWIRKREAKSNCPTLPRTFQGSRKNEKTWFKLCILELLDVSVSAEAPLEPHDADDVRDADGEPIQHAIFRAPGAPRPVADLNEANFVALAQHQRDQIAVHVIEIGKGEIGLALERLQAATGILGGVADERAPDAVGEHRSHPLGPTVLPLRPLARNHAEAGIGFEFTETRDELRNIVGIVLAVAIKRDHELAPRGAHAGAHRPALAKISRVRKNAQFQLRS